MPRRSPYEEDYEYDNYDDTRYGDRHYNKEKKEFEKKKKWDRESQYDRDHDYDEQR